MVKEEKIAQAKELRQADKLEQSQAVLLELLESYPDDPLVLFEVGGSYDVMGEERQAIPFYQRAIETGLEGEDLQECFVCLGSSYRIIGEFEKAIEVLETAGETFPDDNSAQVFLALAYYSDGREDDAVSILIDVLLKTTQDEGILVYADVLDYYKDNLDETLDEE